MAETTEFTIIKGKALDFAIIVKENGSTLPLVLTATDTFTFSIVDKKTQAKLLSDKAMVLTDLLNGEVGGTISAVESEVFPVMVSAPEDWYISRPNLRLVISGNTVNQGEMSAIIEDVYVVVG
jgi:hypothetical protein